MSVSHAKGLIKKRQKVPADLRDMVFRHLDVQAEWLGSEPFFLRFYSFHSDETGIESFSCQFEKSIVLPTHCKAVTK